MDPDQDPRPTEKMFLIRICNPGLVLSSNRFKEKWSATTPLTPREVAGIIHKGKGKDYPYWICEPYRHSKHIVFSAGGDNPPMCAPPMIVLMNYNSALPLFSSFLSGQRE